MSQEVCQFLKLDKNNQLVCDDDNYILQRKRKRKKQDGKSNEGQTIGYLEGLGASVTGVLKQR